MEKILFTGPPGVGKSTIIKGLHEMCASRVTGVIAGEIRDGTRRLGFTSGPFENPHLVTIAHVDSSSPIRVSRYGVELDALNQVASQLALKLELARTMGLVLVFDEIGLMQSYSERLRTKIESVLESSVPAILTIKADDSQSGWLKQIKSFPETRIVSVSETTRTEKLNELLAYIRSSSVSD